MTSAQAADFWTTVAQIVPVLALTLVLELRHTASQWRLENKAQRRIESFVLLAVGVLLYWLFLDALNGISGKHAMSARSAANLLSVALFLLALNPLWLGMLRANSDLVEKIASPAARLAIRRRLSRDLPPLERDVRALASVLDDAIAQTQSIIVDARRLAALREMPTNDDMNVFRSMLDRTPSLENGTDEAILLVRDALAKYERAPSLMSSSRLFHTFLWAWLDRLAFLRRAKSVSDDHLRRINAIGLASTRRSVDDDRMAELQEEIANAGRDFLTVWPHPSPLRANPVGPNTQIDE